MAKLAGFSIPDKVVCPICFRRVGVRYNGFLFSHPAPRHAKDEDKQGTRCRGGLTGRIKYQYEVMEVGPIADVAEKVKVGSHLLYHFIHTDGEGLCRVSESIYIPMKLKIIGVGIGVSNDNKGKLYDFEGTLKK